MSSKSKILVVTLAVLSSTYSTNAVGLTEAVTTGPMVRSYMESFGYTQDMGINPKRFNSHGMNIAGLMNQAAAQIPHFPGLNVFPTRRRLSANNFTMGHPVVALPRDVRQSGAVYDHPLKKDLNLNFPFMVEKELNYYEQKSIEDFWYDKDLSLTLPRSSSSMAI